MSWLKLSTRARVAAVVAAVTAILLVAISFSVYVSMGSALLDEVDSGLRFRAEAYLSHPGSRPLPRPDPALQEPREAFFQLVSRGGRVLDETASLPTGTLLTRADLAGVSRPTTSTRVVTGVPDVARLLAVPVSSGRVLILGQTLADRSDALRQLALVLAVAGSAAVVIASLAGWFVAGLGLRPVERMRRQAAAITASGVDRRLDVQSADREIRALASTLNDLLGRLEQSARRDRDFLERASHELRTPLTALTAELEVAAAGPRTIKALADAIDSASEEAERLTRLANDLLALARLEGDRLPATTAPVPLRRLLAATAAAHTARSAAHGIRVEVECAADVVLLDEIRIRQALDNLVDNAIRHGRGVNCIRLIARDVAGSVDISVVDDGAGFDDVDRLRAGLRVPAAPAARGLGLRIAAAVAAGHGGRLELSNVTAGGGAMASLLLPQRTDP